MTNYKIIYNNELYHHGILGQKWGVRNGPPYPLSAGDHSKAEKKAGWRQSLSSYSSSVKGAKAARKERDDAIQKAYEKTEKRIESKYKNFENLSEKDADKLNKADAKARSDWKNSKDQYKAEKAEAFKKLTDRIVNSGKTGAKYDFSKDNTPGADEKLIANQAYSAAKMAASYGLNAVAKTAITKVIEATGKEALEVVIGPGAMLATKAVLDIGEAAVHKYLNTKEKVRLNELRSDKEIDPKTGLHLKSKNDTLDDIKAVNPKYQENNASIGATMNCYNCTIAYDMRQRGYDVSAALHLSGYNPKITTPYLYKNSKQNKDVYGKGKPLTAFTKNGNVKLAEDLMNKMSSEPDGSRGMLALYWPGGGGHAMTYEVKNGNAYIIDAQSGRKYSTQESKDILACGTRGFYKRLDNLEINEKNMKRHVL